MPNNFKKFKDINAICTQKKNNRIMKCGLFKHYKIYPAFCNIGLITSFNRSGVKGLVT